MHLLILLSTTLMAAAELRHAEEFKVSLYGELTGLTVTSTSANVVNGIPPSGLISRRVNTKDFMGADHSLSYMAESSDDVVILEHHDGVLGVDCGVKGNLTIHVDDIDRFLKGLPMDPDSCLFVLGPGWGCKAPSTSIDELGGRGVGESSTCTTSSTDGCSSSSTTDSSSTSPPVADETEREKLLTLATLEPDGDTVYLRSTGLLQTMPKGDGSITWLIVFQVENATLMDAFAQADISYTRSMSEDARENLGKTFQQATKNAAEAAAAVNTSTGDRRRLSLRDAYVQARIPPDHPDASASLGLTPHKRALRRLGLTYQLYDDASSSWSGPCVTWISTRCVWGVNALYSYDVVNWNYDVNKAFACRQAGRNPEVCSRASQPTISLLGSVVTCRSCYFYIGGDMRFKLIFDRRTVQSFMIAVSAAASTAIDIQIAFPNGQYSYGPQTTALVPRTRVVTLPIPLVALDLSLSIFTTLGVELTATAGTSGRIIGPGYWFDASATIGASYESSSGWQDLTSTSLYMNSRAPVLDITIAANAKMKSIVGLELSGNLMGIAWPIFFYLKPYMDLNLQISTRCSSNFVSIALAAGLDASVAIGGPSFSVLGKNVGPLFQPVNFGDLVLVPFALFTCSGCSGCVDGASGGGISGAASSGGSGGSVGSCGVTWQSDAWGPCQADCGNGVQTRKVQCRDCSGFLSTGCTGTVPASAQSCTVATACSGPFVLTNLKATTGSLGKASSTNSNGYRVFQLNPPPVFITPVSGASSTYAYVSLVLQTFSGDTDLYLFLKAPTTMPASDGMGCCATWGSCVVANQPDLYGSSCSSGLESESMQLSWGATAPYTLYIIVQGFSASNLFRFTAAYYNKLLSSLPLSVSESAATSDSSQMFRFVSSATAYGFITFVTPAGDGDPDIYVKAWNNTDWPSTSNFLVSSATAGEDFVAVSGSDFRPGIEYALLANVYVGGAYSIVAANLFLLTAGQSISGVTPSQGLVYFQFSVPTRADRVDIVLTSTSSQDPDLFVGTKIFRPLSPNSENVQCNCNWYSRLPGDDSIHIDWLDPDWGTTLYIAVYGYSAATFVLTVTPHMFMGEATPYRITTAFGSPLFLLSGEGRTQGARYSDTTGSLVSDDSDCEFVADCSDLESSLPTSMSTCTYGRRRMQEDVNKTVGSVSTLLRGGEKGGRVHPAKDSPSSLSFKQPGRVFSSFHTSKMKSRSLGLASLAMDPEDTFSFGARVSEKRIGSATVDMNIIAWRTARKYPTCYIQAPADYPGKLSIGRGATATQFVGIRVNPYDQGVGMAYLPMAVSLKQISVTEPSGTGRRLFNGHAEGTPSSSSSSPIYVSSPELIVEGPLSPANDPIFHGPENSSLLVVEFPTTVDTASSPSLSDSRTSPFFFGAEQGFAAYSSLADMREDLHFIWAGNREPINQLTVQQSASSQSRGPRSRLLQGQSTPSSSSFPTISLVSAPKGTVANPTALVGSTTCEIFSSPCFSVSVPSSGDGTILSVAVSVPLTARVQLQMKASVSGGGQVLVPVVSTAEAFLVSATSPFTAQDDRPANVLHPFSGVVGDKSGPITVTGSQAVFDMRLCESSSTAPDSQALVLLSIDTKNAVAAVDTFPVVSVEIFASVVVPSCPVFYWKAGEWSTCDSETCSDTTGAQTRSVVCVSAAAPTVAVDAGPHTCSVDSQPSGMLSCTRTQTCTSEAIATYTDGSLTTDVDVMGYVGRRIPTDGTAGASVEIPKGANSIWTYALSSSSSASDNPHTGALCLSMTVTPVSIYDGGCTYQHLSNAFKCLDTFQSCKSAFTSNWLSLQDALCSCYTLFASCIAGGVCDDGIYGRVKAARISLDEDIIAGTVTPTCSMPDNSTVPIDSSAVQAVADVEASLGSVQVLAVSTDYSTESAVNLWMNPLSSVWMAKILGTTTGATQHNISVPLFYNAKNATPSALSRLEVLVSATTPIRVVPTITALTMSSISSQILMSGPLVITEADVRSGGTKWTLAVQCDTLLQSAFNPASNTLLVEGISVSSASPPNGEPFGWTATAVPIFLASSTTAGVAYETSTSFTITLPPIPFYRLRANEMLRFKVPGTYTSSGLENDIQLSVVVTALSSSSSPCIVGSWDTTITRTLASADAYVPSTYARTRSIVSDAAGDGEPCPQLSSTTTRSFTDFDASCAFFSCSGRGTCVIVDGNAWCACFAGYFGSDCSIIGSLSPEVTVEQVRRSWVSSGTWTGCARACSSSDATPPNRRTLTTTCLLSSTTTSYDSACNTVLPSSLSAKDCLTTDVNSYAFFTLPISLSPQGLDAIKALGSDITSSSGSTLTSFEALSADVSARVKGALNLAASLGISELTVISTSFHSQQNVVVFSFEMALSATASAAKAELSVALSRIATLSSTFLTSPSSVTDVSFLQYLASMCVSREVHVATTTLKLTTQTGTCQEQLVDLWPPVPTPTASPSTASSSSPVPSSDPIQSASVSPSSSGSTDASGVSSATPASTTNQASTPSENPSSSPSENPSSSPSENPSSPSAGASSMPATSSPTAPLSSATTAGSTSPAPASASPTASLSRIPSASPSPSPSSSLIPLPDVVAFAFTLPGENPQLLANNSGVLCGTRAALAAVAGVSLNAVTIVSITNVETGAKALMPSSAIQQQAAPCQPVRRLHDKIGMIMSHPDYVGAENRRLSASVLVIDVRIIVINSTLAAGLTPSTSQGRGLTLEALVAKAIANTFADPVALNTMLTNVVNAACAASGITQCPPPSDVIQVQALSHAPQAISPSTSSDASQSTFSNSMVIGAAVGAIVGVLLLGVGGYFIYRTSTRSAEKKQETKEQIVLSAASTDASSSSGAGQSSVKVMGRGRPLDAAVPDGAFVAENPMMAVHRQPSQVPYAIQPRQQTSLDVTSRKAQPWEQEQDGNTQGEVGQRAADRPRKAFDPMRLTHAPLAGNMTPPPPPISAPSVSPASPVSPAPVIPSAHLPSSKARV